jgi:phosphoribosylanthranilate isomerase
MFVKICGVKNRRELKIVECYADATGVVVRAQSRRAINLNAAREIISSAKIPVFVVSTQLNYEGWAEIIEKTKASHIQVHSEMNAREFEKLRKNFNGVIMKAFVVPQESEDVEREAISIALRTLSYDADYFLLDTGKGSGKLHDLRVSKEIVRMLKARTILAGGLNPDNVSKIAEYVKPFGVDVSSGVEKDGSKDAKLVRAFVKGAKGKEKVKR